MDTITTQPTSSSSYRSYNMSAEYALGVDNTPESQMAVYSEHVLPTALIDLRNKHGYVNQVIQYCETAYLSQDKREIEVSVCCAG